MHTGELQLPPIVKPRSLLPPSPLRILIACEISGIVRRAFATLGHDAWSCDLLPSSDRSNKHIIADVRDVLDEGWDMLIVAHPPCTRLCNSGVRWLTTPPPGSTIDQMWQELHDGADLFSALWNAQIPRRAIENPIMHKHAKALIRGYVPPAQTIQPWQFGDWETKATSLWLSGLAPLSPQFSTISDAQKILGKPPEARPVARVHSMPAGPARRRLRSHFFPGIANAMAAQWGGSCA